MRKQISTSGTINQKFKQNINIRVKSLYCSACLNNFTRLPEENSVGCSRFKCRKRNSTSSFFRNAPFFNAKIAWSKTLEVIEPFVYGIAYKNISSKLVISKQTVGRIIKSVLLNVKTYVKKSRSTWRRKYCC